VKWTFKFESNQQFKPVILDITVGKMQNYVNVKPGLYRISTEPYTSNSFTYQFFVIFNDVQII